MKNESLSSQQSRSNLSSTRIPRKNSSKRLVFKKSGAETQIILQEKSPGDALPVYITSTSKRADSHTSLQPTSLSSKKDFVISNTKYSKKVMSQELLSLKEETLNILDNKVERNIIKILESQVSELAKQVELQVYSEKSMKEIIDKDKEKIEETNEEKNLLQNQIHREREVKLAFEQKYKEVKQMSLELKNENSKLKENLREALQLYKEAKEKLEKYSRKHNHKELDHNDEISKLNIVLRKCSHDRDELKALYIEGVDKINDLKVESLIIR